jgi:hypothetical protein
MSNLDKLNRAVTYYNDMFVAAQSRRANAVLDLREFDAAHPDIDIYNSERRLIVREVNLAMADAEHFAYLRARARAELSAAINHLPVEDAS